MTVNVNGQFWGEKGRPIVKRRNLLPWDMQKPLNRSRCRLRLWTRACTRKHVLDGMHIGTTWRIRLNPSMCGSDAAFLWNYFDHLLSLLTLGSRWFWGIKNISITTICSNVYESCGGVWLYVILIRKPSKHSRDMNALITGFSNSIV